jgi:hypothetical protein
LIDEQNQGKESDLSRLRRLAGAVEKKTIVQKIVPRISYDFVHVFQPSCSVLKNSFFLQKTSEVL